MHITSYEYVSLCSMEWNQVLNRDGKETDVVYEYNPRTVHGGHCIVLMIFIYYLDSILMDRSDGLAYLHDWWVYDH